MIIVILLRRSNSIQHLFPWHPQTGAAPRLECREPLCWAYLLGLPSTAPAWASSREPAAALTEPPVAPGKRR